MATTLMNAGRPLSSMSVSKSLPVIQHPMSRLGDKTELSLRGESRQGKRILNLQGRENTLVTIDTGRVHLGLNRDVLPPLNDRGGQKSRILNWPPEYLKNAKKEKPKKTGESFPKFSADELHATINEKLTTSIHGIKHLFKANDPSGEGVVSKEGLLRILYSLVGYISPLQYTRLLQRLDLAGKQSVSFEQFLNCFHDNETIQKEWIIPAQQVRIRDGTGNTSPDGQSGSGDRYVSATYCFSLLKKRIETGDPDIKTLLPPSCLQPDGVVVPPQLREAAVMLGYRMTDEEFLKFWQRYDLEGTGAVRSSVLFRMLGLDQRGNVKMSASQRRVMTGRRNKNETKPDGDNTEKQKESEPQLTPRKLLVPSDQHKKKLKSAKVRKAPPRLESIMDCLHYQFEIPYSQLLEGFKCFDLMDDGFISKIDFKQVLVEFGFPVQCIALDHFFSRNGIRVIRGHVAYMDFLLKFWNKSETGLVNRIATNSFHMFSKDSLPETGLMSAEELEARLVDFLHKDFLVLLARLRNVDKYNIGVATPHAVRSCVEQTLGYKMAEHQWEELRDTIGLDSDGLVPYLKFMERFSERPGKWNQMAKGDIMVKKVSGVQPSAEVECLKERNESWLESHHKKSEVAAEALEKTKAEDNGIPLEKLQEVLVQLFRTRFHSIDKAFKSIDRRMTSRICKHQFKDMLAMCDMELKPSELNQVWPTLPLATDGMISFAQLIRHFNSLANRQISPPGTNKLPPSEGTKALLERVKEARKQRQAAVETSLLDEPEVPVPRPGSRDRDQLLMRIRPNILEHWERLKGLFRVLDKDGISTVSVADMREIVTALQFPLTSDELNTFLKCFDKKGNGRFNYIDLLQPFTEESKQNQRNNNEYILQQRQPSASTVWYDGNGPSLRHVLARLRCKLIKEWKSIRRAFKRMDSSNSGSLSVTDFRKVLESCRIGVTNEDVYHIMSEFDSKLDGRVSYDDFLQHVMMTV